MEFNCLKATANSRRQFTFTIQFPEIPGIHFIDLGRMKGLVDLGARPLLHELISLPSNEVNVVKISENEGTYMSK